MTTFAFDVYGTLIDTSGVTRQLALYLDEEAVAFSTLWREKQLEYSFRRGLMEDYNTFSGCTEDAFDYCCERFALELSEEQRHELLAGYQTLPAFEDAAPSLQLLRTMELPLWAFSNGTEEAVTRVLDNAGLGAFFKGVVSVDDVKTFKPSPKVYRHFCQRSGSRAADCWLVSANPFDIIGAIRQGMKGAWIQRDPDTVFDHFGVEPTLRLSSLSQLPQTLEL
ncbi:haloacid dehalogenase type II [Aestuariirhabdus litorea]|uniref:(S)-2-haloacid dehalogenase n=1 Tax=Aestuariirhabdus litorea TaxID=2528527 RepID=A0A3P3VRS7_9GAMM|nr:haloacid dehalogenase type II [Aestuariirhabdus litorea]RRJ84688.1 haloacid dehalogenase type II [Aestuariirhabdus litorea]RWW97913.1 haloacid dehalogenase type II [Endozoicomonadaceae bacterium GTF-13]